MGNIRLNARSPVQPVSTFNQTPATMHGDATVGTVATQPTPATQLETAGEEIVGTTAVTLATAGTNHSQHKHQHKTLVVVCSVDCTQATTSSSRTKATTSSQVVNKMQIHFNT